MAATTVFGAFSVLKDHIKFKVNQNAIVTDNLGNQFSCYSNAFISKLD